MDEQGKNRHIREDDFGLYLNSLISHIQKKEGKKGVLYLCIGSDRSTGDSLGPLIGYKLRKHGGCRILGTLRHPVHALNLEHVAEKIRQYYGNPVIVAVDASVGSASQIGMISVGIGPIRPGLGVKKALRPIGDIYITGIVGTVADGMDYSLQSVRLSLVMEMADAICRGILSAAQDDFVEKNGRESDMVRRILQPSYGTINQQST